MITKAEILEIVDKNVDQEGLAVDLGKKIVKPWLEQQKARLVAGELDLIAGTQIDNELMAKFIDSLLAKLV